VICGDFGEGDGVLGFERIIIVANNNRAVTIAPVRTKSMRRRADEERERRCFFLKGISVVGKSSLKKSSPTLSGSF
jgi:hypothetical protein